MSSEQLTIEEAIFRHIKTDVSNKDTYSDKEMGDFSSWHRRQLPSNYPWTDLDYIGFDYDENRVYILLELKELPEKQFQPFNPSDPPKKNGAQLCVYWFLGNQLKCPSYIVWYPKTLDPSKPTTAQFKIHPITEKDGVVDYRKKQQRNIEGMNDFADFLDMVKEHSK